MPEPSTPPAQLELHSEGRVTTLRLVPGRTGRDADGHGTLPIYRAEGASSDAIATGTLFVQFAGQVDPEQRDALDTAGFEVVRTVPYAPNAAWVRGRGQSAGESLRQIDRLRALPGVESVEPELLRQRSLRTE